jgi:hypothetical protein
VRHDADVTKFTEVLLCHDSFQFSVFSHSFRLAENRKLLYHL